ncbi:MAG: AAA family ATPase, partial [Flavonifractor plautii]
MDRPLYPFTAVVGQERAKQALLCLAVEPRIGGVLLCGEKGTAKSTLVRALGGLDGVRLLELPVSATEDMLLGGVELEAAVRTGCRTFQPGLLARADGAVLYADEVNLLPSALTAALLDTLETGVCRVERDGISHTCPARFALVGTMNPEEGTLRPQLLDRFGLYVAVTGEREPEARKEVRRLALRNPPLRAQWARREERLGGQLAAARALATPGGRGEAEEQACLLARQANAARTGGRPSCTLPAPWPPGAHLHQLGGSPHGGGAGPAPPQAGGKRRPAPATGERGGAPSGIWSGRTGRGRGWTGGRVPPRRRAAAGGGSGPRATHGAGAVPRAVGAGG